MRTRFCSLCLKLCKEFHFSFFYLSFLCIFQGVPGECNCIIPAHSGIGGPVSILAYTYRNKHMGIQLIQSGELLPHKRSLNMHWLLKCTASGFIMTPQGTYWGNIDALFPLCICLCFDICCIILNFKIFHIFCLCKHTTLLWFWILLLPGSSRNSNKHMAARASGLICQVW